MRAVVDHPRWALKEIALALRYPAFALYLGRRSCPLGAPLRPEIFDVVAGPEAVLLSSAKSHSGHRGGDRPIHAAECSEDLGGSNRGRHRRRRTDQPLDRSAWHFGTRDEWAEEIG